jgi:serine/threonine-protein kinase
MPTVRQSQCDPHRLDEFLHHRLSTEFESDVEVHLLACVDCRDRLDEIAGGDRWWGDVHRYLGDEDGAPTSDDDGPGRRMGLDLGFLEPTEFPNSLGRLGTYEILEVVGQGGMGIVLKGFDLTLNRLVAIKVLAAEHARRGAARKRFAREAQAVAAVVHDHIVSIHAVDAESTPPYLVMAYIPGQSLQQRIDKSGPLEVKEILRIGMQTAAGLAAAHAQGIVHRDIKPANIMLENGIERVRITDFGLARAIDDASVTQNGAVAGTPQYMAPEQARGEVIDQRADLFSLGGVIYAMATGRAPFHGDGGLAVIRQVSDVEPTPIRAINPEIPPWLDGIVRKLHAKDVASRFQSANDVAELLEQCLAHVQDPTSHRLPAVAEELGRSAYPPPKMDEIRWRWIIAALVVVGVCASAIFFARRPTIGNESMAHETVAPPVTAEMAEVIEEYFRGKYHQETNRVRSSAVGMQNRLHAPVPDIPDPRWETMRHRADGLQSSFYPVNEPTYDPISSAMWDVRHRLQVLRQDLAPRTQPRP